MTPRRPMSSLACRVARRRLGEREAGLLGPDETARLEGHLDGCPACRREAVIDGALTVELALLRSEYPYPIDVSGRVLRALDAAQRRPEIAADVAPGQLGLAAAVAVAATIAIVVSTGLGLAAIVDGARQCWMIVTTAADTVIPLARAAIELASIPLRSALLFVTELLTGLAGLADRWLPSALTLTAMAYLAMGVTMARVIARGFASAPASGRHGRTA